MFNKMIQKKVDAALREHLIRINLDLAVIGRKIEDDRNSAEEWRTKESEKSAKWNARQDKNQNAQDEHAKQVEKFLGTMCALIERLIFVPSAEKE